MVEPPSKTLLSLSPLFPSPLPLLFLFLTLELALILENNSPNMYFSKML